MERDSCVFHARAAKPHKYVGDVLDTEPTAAENEWAFAVGGPEAVPSAQGQQPRLDAPHSVQRRSLAPCFAKVLSSVHAFRSEPKLGQEPVTLESDTSETEKIAPHAPSKSSASSTGTCHTPRTSMSFRSRSPRPVSRSRITSSHHSAARWRARRSCPPGVGQPSAGRHCQLARVRSASAGCFDRRGEESRPRRCEYRQCVAHH
jgi:hypothetical protein